MTDIDVDAPVVEMETPPVAETVPPEVEPVATEEEPKQDEPKYTKAEVEQRIQERLAKEQRRHDREIRQTLERENERLRAATQPKPVEPQGRPSREQFPDDISYIRADADWAGQQASQKAIAEFKQEYQRGEQQRQFEGVVDKFQKRVDALAKDNPDFDEIIKDRGFPMSRPMAEAVVLSSGGDNLALYLWKNRNEAERISKLPDSLAGIELGKIVAKLEPASAKTISTAPPPIKPVTSTQAIVKDLESLSQEEFEKRLAKERKPRR